MTVIDSDTWSHLVKPSGDRLVARLALSGITDRLYCALDSKGHRHLLVALASTDENYADSNSRGLNIFTRELAVRGHSLHRYVDIECLEPAGHAILDFIGGEIADELRDQSVSAVDGIRRVLSRWRRFWGQMPQQLLSREQQLGLFAEFWFLLNWLMPRFGPEAITAWRGPWGSRHDFEWGDKSVEVKATTSSRGRHFKIHGLSQLENPAAGPLYLYCICLIEDVGSTNNLPSLIDNCYQRINDADEMLIRFESALVQAGYSPMHREVYANLKLHVVEEALFRVSDDFPRLTHSTFLTGVPAGVERIEYEIDLNTFDHLIVATSPDLLPFA